MRKDNAAPDRGTRSRVGHGKQVHIICGDPEADGKGYEEHDVVWGTTGEDYAVSRWPIVVKCDVRLTRKQVVDHLLWLASKLDQ